MNLQIIPNQQETILLFINLLCDLHAVPHNRKSLKPPTSHPSILKYEMPTLIFQLEKLVFRLKLTCLCLTQASGHQADPDHAAELPHHGENVALLPAAPQSLMNVVV